MTNTNENLDMLYRIREELEEIYQGKAKTEDGETATFYDYFEDVLDFEYTVNSRREFVGVKVWITLGGPNIWLDTRSQEICLAWGSDREAVWLPSEFCQEIDYIFEEYYNS